MHEFEQLPFAILGEGIGVRTLLAAGDPAGARTFLDAPAPTAGYDFGINMTRMQYLNGIVTATEGNTREGRALVRGALVHGEVHDRIMPCHPTGDLGLRQTVVTGDRDW
jgi:hypothetical protein